MGGNRRFSTPEQYPGVFLTSIESGHGIILAGDTPWTLGSTAKRFRLCLAVIKDRPNHPLYTQACRRWSVRENGSALEVHVSDAIEPAPVNPGLVMQALLAAETGDDGGKALST